MKTVMTQGDSLSSGAPNATPVSQTLGETPSRKVEPLPPRQNELNEKVARLCGAKAYLRPWDGRVFLCAERPAPTWEITDSRVDVINSDVPKYTTDLNACHEFEKGLTHEQCLEYHMALQTVQAEMTQGRDGETEYPAQDFWFHATAEQRCRAFIAVMERNDVEKGS